MRMWNYLDSMKLEHRADGMLLVHGSPRDPVREYIVPRDALDHEKMEGCFEKMADADLCFIGHSHVPGVYKRSGGYQSPPELDNVWRLQDGEQAIVNIGSVGQPRDGDTRATFASWDGEAVRFHRVEYDFRKTMDKIRAVSELPDYLADRLAQGR